MVMMMRMMAVRFSFIRKADVALALIQGCEDGWIDGIGRKSGSVHEKDSLTLRNGIPTNSGVDTFSSVLSRSIN